MPVLVGCGEVTDTATPASDARPPYDPIARAARLALADTGVAGIGEAIDTLAMVRLFADTSHRFARDFGGPDNPPRSVANRLGIAPGRCLYTWNGGNMPQVLVNLFAEELAAGRLRAALSCGDEALRTQHALQRAGLMAQWAESPGGAPELVGDPRRGWSDHEDRHGLRAAVLMYPLFENAPRAARGRTVEQHQRAIGEPMSRFAAVAAANPLAVRRDGFTAGQLVSVDGRNRWIAFPYPRLMNAHADIDQAAALVMTTVGTVRELGIAPDRWVFLHGCADANDAWFVSERADFHSSPAIRAAGGRNVFTPH